MMNVAQIYKDAEALLEGHFKLSSGNHSKFYLQSAKVLEDPKTAKLLAEALAVQIKESGIKVDAVCSPALGGLIAGAKNNVQYTYKENTRFASATYFSYKFLTDIVIKDEAKIVAIELSQQIKQFKLYAYYSAKTNQQYLYFSNSSGHQINLKIDAVVKSINYNYIVANKLYAHTGEAHFIKDNPTKNEFIELKKETIQNNTISIKPYSLGVIQY